MAGKITVLRLSHRKVRDVRATTHCGLVARAMGARAFVIAGERDESVMDSLRKVTLKWGGPFEVSYCLGALRFAKQFKGKKVHLTMYGEQLMEKADEMRKALAGDDLLVIIGSEKVPREFYDISDYNIAVGNQPHSEVAALAVFLHEIFEGKELQKQFKNAKLRIFPSQKRKIVETIK